MVVNADCTIYHRTFDSKTRTDIWTPIPYPNVSWYGKQAVSVDEKGLNSANHYTVRIFTAATIPVSVGDIIVRGLVADKVTGPPQLVAKYECFEITAVRDNRRGSPCMQHWKLEGR